MLEMFEGFWSWPLSQKIFGSLWLVTLLSCVAGFGVVMYYAV